MMKNKLFKLKMINRGNNKRFYYQKNNYINHTIFRLEGEKIIYYSRDIKDVDFGIRLIISKELYK